MAVQAGADDNLGTNTMIEFLDGDGTDIGGITSSSGTITYGQFTANHDVRVPEKHNAKGYPYGTLMCVISTSVNASQPRKILYEAEACNDGPYSKRVLGAYAGKYEKENNLHQVYVLGDGHILVNGEGGDIAIGDPITTSLQEGIGMKATKTGMIIGIAQDDARFTGSESRLLAVQYGLDYYVPNDVLEKLANIK